MLILIKSLVLFLTLDTFSSRSQDADKSAMSPEEVTLTFDSLPDVARRSAGDQQESHKDDDLDDDDEDNSGATRRRAPGKLDTNYTHPSLGSDLSCNHLICQNFLKLQLRYQPLMLPT